MSMYEITGHIDTSYGSPTTHDLNKIESICPSISNNLRLSIDTEVYMFDTEEDMRKAYSDLFNRLCRLHNGRVYELPSTCNWGTGKVFMLSHIKTKRKIDLQYGSVKVFGIVINGYRYEFSDKRDRNKAYNELLAAIKKPQ